MENLNEEKAYLCIFRNVVPAPFSPDQLLRLIQVIASSETTLNPDHKSEGMTFSSEL